MLVPAVGCTEGEDAVDDGATAAVAGTVGAEAGEADAGDGGPTADALQDLAELMAGPGGVLEVSGRLDEALHVRLSVVEECGEDEACFVNYRRSVGPPEEVRDLLEEYLDRVLDVRQEVARVTADAPADGAVVAVESAQQWYEAAVLSARIAMATVQCLYDLEPAQYLRAVAWCTYQRDLYAAAVHDQNRLRQEFEQAYAAFVGSAGAGQGV